MKISRLSLLALCLSSFVSFGEAAEAYKWSVQYIVDNSRYSAGRSQAVWPRRNRGLALAPDGKSIYVGYHHSFNGLGEVRKVALGNNDLDRGTVAVLPGPLGKSISCDDKGRVYIADVSEVHIYDADLKEKLGQIISGQCDGVAATREDGKLVVYTGDRSENTVTRWVLAEGENGLITSSTPEGLGGEGTVRVKGSLSLRGIALDKKGNVWCADLDGNQVIRVSPDGKNFQQVDVRSPMAIAVDGERIYVSRWQERAITVLDENMKVIGNLNVPWEQLELSPNGNNHNGALSGIVAIPGEGFMVANEAGQTANQKSTYGRNDDHTTVWENKETGERKVFKDGLMDDNEPVLRATIVEAK